MPSNKEQMDSGAVNQPQEPYPDVDDFQRLNAEGAEWDRRMARTSIFGVLVLGGALFLSLLFNIIQFAARPEPKILGLTPDMRVLSLPLLSEPFVNEQGLKSWVGEAVVRSFSLSFRHWNVNLEDVSQFYTRNAFGLLLKTLDESGIREMVEKKRLIASASLEGAPVIIGKDILHGRYAWLIEFPLIISYESSERVISTQHVLASVLVQRQPATEYGNGIAITRLVLEPRKK